MLSGALSFYKLRQYTSVLSTGMCDVRKKETVGEIHATRPARVTYVKHPRAAV